MLIISGIEIQHLEIRSCVFAPGPLRLSDKRELTGYSNQMDRLPKQKEKNTKHESYMKLKDREICKEKPCNA